MKKLVLLVAVLIPLVAGAQEFCARTSVGADYLIKKGFHLTAEEEIRLSDGLAGLGSVRSTIGLSYKVSDYFNFGGGYTLINSLQAPRHRVFAEAMGTYGYGDFLFFLNERLQFTHRTGNFNIYQDTRNALSLKTSLGARYKGFKDIEPYGYLEIRAALNEPWGETYGNLMTTPDSQINYYSYNHTGYNHAYINRYRVDIGADYRPVKHHTIKARMLFDWCSDFEIDTDGSLLFTSTTGWNDYFRASLCVGYVYSF